MSNDLSGVQFPVLRDTVFAVEGVKVDSDFLFIKVTNIILIIMIRKHDTK